MLLTILKSINSVLVCLCDSLGFESDGISLNGWAWEITYPLDSKWICLFTLALKNSHITAGNNTRSRPLEIIILLIVGRTVLLL